LLGSGGAAAECQNLGGAGAYNALGSGTPEQPYLICSAAQLVDLSFEPNAWSRYFLMGSDIDMTGYGTLEYTPIGSETVPFSGVFGGGGFTIRNFVWHDAGRDNAGLFGVVRGSRAELRRIHMVGVDIHGRVGVGVLVGFLSGTVYDCSASGVVVGYGDRI